MSPHSTILLNARAGALKATASVEHVQEMAEQLNLECDVIGTEGPEEMRSRIRALVRENAPRIVVAGGDGTIHLAVQEMVCSNSTLGIIPQGTANNFASALRLPQDLPSALRVLVEGQVREVDLGRAGDTYFTESAGVGLFADALALYGQGTNKNILRAFYAMARVIFSLRARRLFIEMDGERDVERAVLCIAANSFRMGYAMPVAPGARVTDGLLDVVILGDVRIGELLTYYRAIRAQVHENLPKVRMERARTITISSRRRMNVHCDDQVIGTTPVTITVVPRAIKVMVDRL